MTGAGKAKEAIKEKKYLLVRVPLCKLRLSKCVSFSQLDIVSVFIDETIHLMNEEVIKYQCCICKGTISSEEKTSHLDPCALLVISNIDEPRDNQKEQEFYSHFECFRKLVNDDGNLYIMEEDFPTMGEIAQEDWSEDEELLN